MKIEKAIKYFEDEIRFCERAPAINGCQMTGDWLLTLEASKLAVEALKEKQERENHAADMRARRDNAPNMEHWSPATKKLYDDVMESLTRQDGDNDG